MRLNESIRSLLLPFALLLSASVLVLTVAAQQPGTATPAQRAGTTVQPKTTATQTSSAPAATPAKQDATPDKKEKNEAATVDVKPSTNRERRAAAKLFLKAAKLFEASKFDEAMALDLKAAELDPTNANYAAAAEVARGHAVTEWIHAATVNKNRGDQSTARDDLARALDLDPKNPLAAQHIDELATETALNLAKPMYFDNANSMGPPIELLPNNEKHSFHVKASARQVIQQVFKAYGIETIIDDTVRSQVIRFDVDNVDFAQATKLVKMATLSFYTAIDAHRALVARDNTDLRTQYTRQELETIYLPALTEKERNDIQTVAKTLFELQQSQIDATANTLTVRGMPTTLDAFNRTLSLLIEGHSQVVIDVKLMELSHTTGRNTGATIPQSTYVFPVGIEAARLISQNQTFVDELISSGTVSASNTLGILAALYASGLVTDPLLTQFLTGGAGFIGGGSSLTGITPMNSTVALNINASETRALDSMQLRLGDDEKGTFKTGVRYPITTSSYSSALTSTASGLTSSGTSSSLSSLLTSSLSSALNTPMVEYQDIGLNLTATPKILRDSDVALTIDLKLTSLAGSSINSVPVLNNRAYSAVITVKEGEAAVLVSDLDKQESKALSGTPGLSEIPGLNNISSDDKTTSRTTLLIVLTPHIVRGAHPAGHSPMMVIDRKTGAH